MKNSPVRLAALGLVIFTTGTAWGQTAPGYGGTRVPPTIEMPPWNLDPSGMYRPNNQLDDGSAGGFGNQLWARTEFLSYWFKNSSAPPLVTTGPSNALPTLGQPGTQVLFGNTLDSGYHPGGRFSIGYDFASGDGNPTFGVEGSYFFATMGGSRFSGNSTGTPIISRPFFDLSTGTPVAVVEGVANPAGLGIAPVAGGVAIGDPSRLWGLELNGTVNLCCNPCAGFRLDFIYGFRQLALDEDLSILENLALQDGSGEHIVVHDEFSTRNRFYGGQIGLHGQKFYEYFFIDGIAKVALGDMHTVVGINGSTTDSLPGFPSVTAPGGLLAQSTNIGRHTSDSFCVVPEVQLNLGTNITDRLKVYVGYNYLYVSQVARPGGQIDLGVNSNLVPAFAGGTQLPTTSGGPARPAYVLNKTDFYVHGIVAGMEFRY